MSTKYHLITLLFGLSALFFGCDTPSSSDAADKPLITAFDFRPGPISFDPQTDGVKDTTLRYKASFEFSGLTKETKLIYSLLNVTTQNNLINEEIFIDPDSTTFTITLDIETQTTLFNEYKFRATIFEGGYIGNFAESTFEVEGFSVIPPVILEADNPSAVRKPDEGSILIPFTAKVTDPEGQNTLKNVYLRLISRTTGEVSASPFMLFDNGVQGGDDVAGDSVYTVTFPVSVQNQSQTYDILYYATDKGGLVSDTVKTIFRILD